MPLRQGILFLLLLLDMLVKIFVVLFFKLVGSPLFSKSIYHILSDVSWMPSSITSLDSSSITASNFFLVRIIFMPTLQN